MNKKQQMTQRQKKGLIIMFLGLMFTVLISMLTEVIFTNASLTTNNLLKLFSFTGTSIAIYAIGIYILPKGPVTMNLPDPKLIKNYLKGLSIGTVMILAYIGLAILFGGIEYKGYGQISIVILILYFLAFVIQGFTEEFLIRGLIQQSLAKKNKLLSIIGPSIIFSLMHLGNDNFSLIAMINTFLVGLLYALMTDITGSLWQAAAAHSIWNFLLGPFFGLYVSGIPMEKTLLSFIVMPNKESISGGLYGPEASILVLIIIILSILPLLYIYIYILKEKNK